MFPRFSLPYIDPLAFVLGFLAASIFWWMVARIRPLLKEMRQEMSERRETSRARGSSNLEENHRKATLHRAQGMHLSASLFALDEILVEPRLLAPPPRIAPDTPIFTEDIVSQALPYLPSWPELAAEYNAPTIGLGEATQGDFHLAITGQCGTGKTVALAHLACLSARRDPSLGKLAEAVPILVHVADLILPFPEGRDVLGPLTELVSEDAAVFDLPRVPSFVQQLFKGGHVLLLLDGVDELAPDGMEHVRAYLSALMQAYPRTRVVTTICPDNMSALTGLGFTPMAIRPWGNAERTVFLERWSENWERFVAVEAWAQTGPHLPDPILLNAWVLPESNTLTPLEFTLKTWGAYGGDGRGPRPLDAIETHLRRITPSGIPALALETLAMQITLTGQPVFDPRKAREWVRSFEPPEERPVETPEEDAETPDGRDKSGRNRKGRRRQPTPTPGLLSKLSDSGLLVAYPNNRMRFIHTVFSGYLAGRSLTAYDATGTLLDQPAWTGLAMAMRYLAAFGDVSTLVDELLKTTALPMHRPLLLASRWLRDAPREAPWRGKLLTALMQLLQNEGQPVSLRGQAMAAFALSSDPGASALFRQAITTTSTDMMRLAALGSGALGDSKAIPNLNGLFQVPSRTVRQAACLALVAIGSTPALEVVATALLHGDEDLRRAAAEALANHPTEGYPMLRDGATMEDPAVRRAVVYGLGRVRQPWADAILRDLQVQDNQWVVRNAATEVLDSRQQTHPGIPHKLTPAADTPWLVEFAGSQGTGIVPGTPGTDVLLLGLKSEKEEIRLGVVAYLKATPSEGVLGNLYQAMYSGDPELREAIFLAIWELAAHGTKLPNPNKYGVG